MDVQEKRKQIEVNERIKQLFANSNQDSDCRPVNFDSVGNACKALRIAHPNASIEVTGIICSQEDSALLITLTNAYVRNKDTKIVKCSAEDVKVARLSCAGININALEKSSHGSVSEFERFIISPHIPHSAYINTIRKIQKAHNLPKKSFKYDPKLYEDKYIEFDKKTKTFTDITLLLFTEELSSTIASDGSFDID